jgi:ribosomal protein L3 glutamine methyltransferase
VEIFNSVSVARQLDTIGDYLRFAASQFNQAELYFGHGSDNAWHEAITLVMFGINLPQHLYPEVSAFRLVDEEKLKVLSLIERRISENIPAAYITNLALFAGLPFYVDERVLVPRSPIGELIENKFAPFINPDNQPTRILDLCTGSGCIAIACASVFADAEIDALDLSLDALNVAQINIEQHGLEHRVIPIQSDVFSQIPELTYDLIVSNPPYVDQDDVDNLPAEYRHEPEMGLGCGEDGLDIVRVILAQAESHLNDQGLLVCEVGNSQVHVEAAYPEVPFTWLTFERGGHGVFMLTKAQLQQYASLFKQQLNVVII